MSTNHPLYGTWASMRNRIRARGYRNNASCDSPLPNYERMAIEQGMDVSDYYDTDR